MGLPDSYTQKPNAVPSYFQAILEAQPPDRFSIKFLENLGFTSTNDRLFLSILKELGFLNADGAPQQRYFDYLDRSQSSKILADGIRDMYSDLFAVNKAANELKIDEVRNKLRTLYSGKKTDLVINHIAKTFVALCAIADFSSSPVISNKEPVIENREIPKSKNSDQPPINTTPVDFKSLQYHINIVLPESRDSSVYDAIFKSLKDHLR